MIKKHNNKNSYNLTSEGLWVRDFTSKATPRDINKLIKSSDYDLFLGNELSNASRNLANIDSETIYAPNVVIVSDGYDFTNKQKLLEGLNVTIIGTNRSLAKWNNSEKMDWYVANNPYKECMTYLPKRDYYPRCIISTRTNPEFVVKYKSRRGVIYKYIPVQDEEFCTKFFSVPQYYVDDYRNPICAAISLAYRWGVQKLLLFCCDDSFAQERPGAEELENGLWMYPQQRTSHGLIEGCLYWLKDVIVGNYSSGPESSYDVEDIGKFFLNTT